MPATLAIRSWSAAVISSESLFITGTRSITTPCNANDASMISSTDRWFEIVPSLSLYVFSIVPPVESSAIRFGFTLRRYHARVLRQLLRENRERHASTYRDGLTNHLPMCLTALHRLGANDDRQVVRE